MSANKIVIDSVGIDYDGVIKDSTLYNYATGLEHFTGVKLCDDVLAGNFSRLEELLLVFVERYYKKYGSYPDLDKIIAEPAAYKLRDIFDCSKLREFWLGFLPLLKYFVVYRAREEARVIMHEWHSEGRKLHLITAPKFCGDEVLLPLRKNFRSMFERGLERDDIPFDTLAYCREKESAGDKVKAVEMNNVKLMLEDLPRNIEPLSKVTKVVCFDELYNRDCFGPNIYRTSERFVGTDEIIKKLERGSMVGGHYGY